MMEQFEPKVANKYRMALLALGRPRLQFASRAISRAHAGPAPSESCLKPPLTTAIGAWSARRH